MTEQKPLIVYFGIGQYIPGSMFGPKLKENARYVLVDNQNPDSGFYEQSLFGLEYYPSLPKIMKEKIHYLKANASKSGIVSGSASQVHMYNLLGDPQTRESPKYLIEEATRIIKPDGSIFVGETVTPKDHTIQMLLSLAEKQGLRSEIVFSNVPTQREWFEDTRWESWAEFTSEQLDFLVNNFSIGYDLTQYDSTSFGRTYREWVEMLDLRRSPDSYVVKLTKQ